MASDDEARMTEQEQYLWARVYVDAFRRARSMLSTMEMAAAHASIEANLAVRQMREARP